MNLATLTFATLATLAAACRSDKAAPPPQPTTSAPKVAISVTTKGFEPDHITVQAGTPVTLAFTRKTDDTCAKQVVVELGTGEKVTRDLPLDRAVEIAATFPKGGELRYACAMNMVTGVISVQ